MTNLRLYMFPSGTLQCKLPNIKMNQGLHGNFYELLLEVGVITLSFMSGAQIGQRKTKIKEQTKIVMYPGQRSTGCDGLPADPPPVSLPLASD